MVSAERGESIFLCLALISLSITIQLHLANSDSYEASWLFLASPVRKERLIAATKNYVMSCFVIPYLVCLGIGFAWYFERASHAVIHTAFFVLVAHINLQDVMLRRQFLCYSVERKKRLSSAKRACVVEESEF